MKKANTTPANDRMTEIMSRVTEKSDKPAKAVKPAKVTKEVDPNSPADKRLTFALYMANRAASKVDGCKVFNDWHEQGLTHGEAVDLIAQYNKISGYVAKPKGAKVAKAAKPAKQPVTTAVDPAHMQALMDMLKANGLVITPATK
jgi:hypothetical protein